MNTEYIDSLNKFISLVHMADILNMVVHDDELLKQTGKQVAFEFKLEALKGDGVGFMDQTPEGFGGGQKFFAGIIKKHLETEFKSFKDNETNDILKSNSFATNVKN